MRTTNERLTDLRDFKFSLFDKIAIDVNSFRVRTYVDI